MSKYAELFKSMGCKASSSEAVDRIIETETATVAERGFTLLLVDDEPNVLSALKRALFDEPLEITSVTSAEEALDVLKTDTFKVVVSDERMLGMQGSEFLHMSDSFTHT